MNDNIEFEAFPNLRKIDLLLSIGDLVNNKILYTSVTSGYPANLALSSNGFLFWCSVNKIDIEICVVEHPSAHFIAWYDNYQQNNRVNPIKNGGNIYSDWHIATQATYTGIQRKIGTFVNFLISGVNPSKIKNNKYNHKIYTNTLIASVSFSLLYDVYLKLKNEQIRRHSDYKVTVVTYNDETAKQKEHGMSIKYGFRHENYLPKDDAFKNDPMIIKIKQDEEELKKLIAIVYQKYSEKIQGKCEKSVDVATQFASKTVKAACFGLQILNNAAWEIGSTVCKSLKNKFFVGHGKKNGNGHETIGTIQVGLNNMSNGNLEKSLNNGTGNIEIVGDDIKKNKDIINN